MVASLLWASPHAAAPSSAHANPEAFTTSRLAADPGDTQAALALIHDAMTVSPEGRYHRLLRALRFLEDPDLRPLFARLREDDHAALRVHGLLGTAELSKPRGLTTEDLVDLERDDQRAEVVGAALDGDLLNDATLDQLLAWPGLRPEVKLLLATRRVAAGRVKPGSAAHTAMIATLEQEVVPTAPGEAPDNAPGQRGLAALLLHQLADARGTRALADLNNSPAASRNSVRATLLETARTHGLQHAGTWALSVASESNLPPRLEDLALDVAARFGNAHAHQRWSEHYAQALTKGHGSDQSRLALAALEFASAAKPDFFNALADNPDPFVSAVGNACRAIARFESESTPSHNNQANPQLLEALAQLHATHHPLAHAWLARYAQAPNTSPLHATAVARQLIAHYKTSHAVGRTRRLQAVLDAVEILLKCDPKADTFLARVLHPSRANAPYATTTWTEAVLLGLIRSRTDAATRTASQLPPFTTGNTRALALLLRLRSGTALDENDRVILGQVLRGQTQLDDELRIQAAWAYLKRTDNTDLFNPIPTPTPSTSSTAKP
ncbi:MAG: hypothetical protein V3V20_12625 [Algisphaera sp.]